MDSGEAGQADIANDVGSAAVEDAPASDTKLEVEESLEEGVGDQLPAGEAISGPVSPSSENELTSSTDDGEEHIQSVEEGQIEAESTSRDAELIVGSSLEVASLDDSETSGIEMGSSVAEDVISPEETGPNFWKGSEETPPTDEEDSENILMSENFDDSSVGETAGGELAEEGVDNAETCAASSESVVDPQRKEKSENSAEEGENSSSESHDAAEAEDAQKSVLEAHLPDDTAPGGTLDEPGDDDLGENPADVINNLPTTIARADVVEKGVQEPESEIEPLASEAPESDERASVESAEDVETDLVDEISGKEHGVVEPMGTNLSEGELSNSPLEASEQSDNDSSEAEAVYDYSITSDGVPTEIDSTGSPESSPMVFAEAGEVSASGEEGCSSDEASLQTYPTSSSSRENNEYETQEPVESVLAEGEQEGSLDVSEHELVQDARTETSAEVEAIIEDDQGAKTDLEVESPNPIVTDETDTSSDLAQVAEILEAGDVLVEDVDKSPHLSGESEEIAELGINQQDAETSGAETADEEEVVGAEGEADLASPKVLDAPESSALASTNAFEDTSTGDLDELVDNAAFQGLSPDVGEVVEEHGEPDESFSSMEDVGDYQVGEVEREVETPAAADATGTSPLDSADILEPAEEDEATEGWESVGISVSPTLEENVEVTSRKEGEEERPVGGSEVPEAGDATEWLKNADVSCELTTDADMGSAVGRYEKDSPLSDSKAKEAEDVIDSDGEILAPGFSVPNATGTGLLTSAKIHPEIMETDDASYHEENATLSHLTWDEKIMPREDADVGDAKVSEHDILVRDIPQFSSSLSNLTETNDPEKHQELELQEEFPAATLHENQMSGLCQGEKVPEIFSKVQASDEEVESEDLCGESDSSAPDEVSGISPVDNPEHALVTEVIVSMVPDAIITSSSSAEVSESGEAEDGEPPGSGPEDESTALSSASEKATRMPSSLTEPAVSTRDGSEEGREIGGTESEVKPLAAATSYFPTDSESVKDIILRIGQSALEQGPAIQNLYVTENIGSPAVEGETPSQVKVTESENCENTVHRETRFQDSAAAEEKVIFTTDFEKVSRTADQEDSYHKGDLLPYCSSTSSSDTEESLEAKETIGKLANDGSIHALLHSSGPSSYPLAVLRDREMDQKDISGYDNVSIKDIVTTDLPVEAVKTVSISMPVSSEMEAPPGPSDLKFQSPQRVTSPDIQKREIFSLNEANVAAKMKGEFFMGEENHPLKGQHPFQASKGSTLASSGNEGDSSRRSVAAVDIPTIYQGGTSASLNSPLHLEARNVIRNEVSVPLSSYSGGFSSPSIVVPLAGANEVRHRPIPGASVGPAKSKESVTKSRAQMLRREEDVNDAKFPLSIMLWCSQSLSSLFGSAKSL